MGRITHDKEFPVNFLCQLEITCTERDVDGEFTESFESHDLEGALVRRGEDHEGRRPVAIGTEPVDGGHAPSVAGHQTRKPVVRHRRGEVVADYSLVLEKLGGDHGTDGVAPFVLWSRRATTVSVEAGDGVAATRLQGPTQYVSIIHVPSIAYEPDPALHL